MTRPGSLPLFFRACGALRGMNAQVPDLPMLLRTSRDRQ